MIVHGKCQDFAKCVQLVFTLWQIWNKKDKQNDEDLCESAKGDKLT